MKPNEPLPQAGQPDVPDVQDLAKALEGASTREALASVLRPLRQEHDLHQQPDPSCPFCMGDIT